MTKEEGKILVEDTLNIMADPIYNGTIVKTDLINELRQSWLRANVRLSHRWSLNAWFINAGLDDLLKENGITVKETTCKRGYHLATYYQI